MTITFIITLTVEQLAQAAAVAGFLLLNILIEHSDVADLDAPRGWMQGGRSSSLLRLCRVLSRALHGFYVKWNAFHVVNYPFQRILAAETCWQPFSLRHAAEL